MEKTQIKCPKCGETIDIQDVLVHQLETEVKQKYEVQLSEERKRNKEESDSLQKQKQEFEQFKKKEQELVETRVSAEVAEKRKLLERDLKAKLEEEQSERLKLMQAELEEKSLKLKELNRKEAEIEKLKREKDELKESLKVEAEKEYNATLQTEKLKIKKQEEEKNELHIRELTKQLEDQKKLTEEMKRKQEQGSMQLQGEVQELAIEEWLKAKFPLDTIEEIKKGARGGDCVQVINIHTHQNCGIIYYESKRTKDFQSAWIAKFKEDIKSRGAHIGILVSEVMPSDLERMGLKEGIWICNFEEFKGLCGVIRESLIQIHRATVNQQNKGEKMDMLYDYLTSNTFRMQVEAIVEGFTQMKLDLDAEKRAMQSIWKKREKQIDKVVTNTIEMHSSIKGIAGNAIQTVAALELSSGAEEAKEGKVEL